MKKLFLFLILTSFTSFALLYSMSVPNIDTNQITISKLNSAVGSVSVVDNGTTVTLKNQFVSAVITKTSGTISSYVFDGENILSGGYSGGQLYWSWNRPNYQNPTGCTYQLTADPKTNNYDYAEIKLHMTYNSNDTTAAAQDVDIYYAVKDGVSGLYATGKLSHPASYPLNPGGEWRMAGYVGSQFNWLVVDSARNQVIPSTAATTAVVSGAPKEVVQITSAGSFLNHYECKYDYSADFGETETWGWVSTTKNRGIWMTIPSLEYYPGGPMKRELMCHSAPVILNMFGGTHYGMGGDGAVASGEKWEKIYGPFLIYCNKVPAGTANVPKTLWADAKAQTKLERAKWPYSWFSDSTYLKANKRGTIKGKLVISDPTVPSSSAANMWIGVTIPQSSTTGTTDFQLWSKNYQFWVKTDSVGDFTISNVIPGVYNMYAFGPGAAGQMTKKGYATVTAGNTTDLGSVVWVPTRIAPTVWEIGIPDRSAKEFKHGDDYWVGGAYPDPNWAKFMNYTTEFPTGVNYTVGQSNWSTDWNYAQPYNVVGTAQTVAPEWKVNFKLTSKPTVGSQSAVYVAVASQYLSALIVKVNGVNVSSPNTGNYFSNPSDALIRMGIHGAFADMRVTFLSSLLNAGDNVISFTQRKSGGDFQYDYLRLESPGTSIVSAVEKVSDFSGSKVFPNPFVDSVNLKLSSELTTAASIVIESIDGKIVHQEQIPNGGSDIHIDLPKLKQGIYLMRLISDKSESVYKILKI
jgi:rhamnogalacturonan endolyase